MADTFTPPADVARNAQRALDVRATKPPSQQGMTPVGLARANQLANRDPVSLDTVQRMVSYFARHEVDKQGATWDEQGKGWQAWYGWGGDEGRTWANQIMKENTMETKVSRRHSEADMKRIREVRRMAENIKSYMVELGDDLKEDETSPPPMKAMHEMSAEFNTRQRMMVSSLIEVTHEAGKFDKGIGANGAHYMEAAKNPFAAQGIACEHCYFYQPDGNCAIVEGIIEEYAVCKLWIIPEAVIMMEAMEPTMEMSDVVPMEAEMETIETEEAVAMTNLPLDTPLTIEVGDEVKALARRLLGGRQ
jgi:Pyruvate/2-oxoacid:ferredoxin oxidoreductase delta subunit